MISALRIENLAIVESLEVELGPGLTVITGETGAGKSILVHALELVLGARARPDLIRTGAERAVVEGLFHVGDQPALLARLEALDLPADEELVVRRTVLPGRSRGTVNGRLTTATQLRELAKGLVDISSQHEHHSLADPSTHLATLDAWAQEPGLLGAVAETWAAAEAAARELAELRERAAARHERLDVLRFQLAELDRVDPRPGELEELQAELGRAQPAERLRARAEEAEQVLYARERALCAELARLEGPLAEAAQADPALTPVVEQVASARTELEDVAEQLGRYARGIDTDPQTVLRLEDRLHELKPLVRRFGGDLAAAAEHRAALQQEITELEQVDEVLERLEQASAEALAAATRAAERLSTARKQAAGRLGTAISAELADLGMGGALIEVQVSPKELGPRGMDRAEFLIAPNPGEAPRPMGRIASGGELSRALLATKRVLAGLGPVGTYVFDEVDTGVGGAVAEAIGRKLREVAAHHQVICITHAPQIAALGGAHLRVHKQVEGGRTFSGLHAISAQARVEELARMLGGSQVTDAARAAARELLA